MEDATQWERNVDGGKAYGKWCFSSLNVVSVLRDVLKTSCTRVQLAVLPKVMRLGLAWRTATRASGIGRSGELRSSLFCARLSSVGSNELVSASKEISMFMVSDDTVMHRLRCFKAAMAATTHLCVESCMTTVFLRS